MSREIGTIWVCVCCHIVEATGEDCCAIQPEGHTGPEQWGLIDKYEVASGLSWEEHAEDCPNWEAGKWVADCDCERKDFSQSSCEACGCHLHGSRYAYSLWERQPSE